VLVPRVPADLEQRRRRLEDLIVEDLAESGTVGDVHEALIVDPRALAAEVEDAG
jgi:hypothetical protein